MNKVRSIVKVRQVGDCVVVTLPRVILKEFPVKPGDRVMLETVDNGEIVLTKETEISKNGAQR